MNIPTAGFSRHSLYTSDSVNEKHQAKGLANTQPQEGVKNTRVTGFQCMDIPPHSGQRLKKPTINTANSPSTPALTDSPTTPINDERKPLYGVHAYHGRTKNQNSLRQSPTDTHHTGIQPQIIFKSYTTPSAETATQPLRTATFCSSNHIIHASEQEIDTAYEQLGKERITAISNTAIKRLNKNLTPHFQQTKQQKMAETEAYNRVILEAVDTINTVIATQNKPCPKTNKLWRRLSSLTSNKTINRCLLVAAGITTVAVTAAVVGTGVGVAIMAGIGVLAIGFAASYILKSTLPMAVNFIASRLGFNNLFSSKSTSDNQPTCNHPLSCQKPPSQTIPPMDAKPYQLDWEKSVGARYNAAKNSAIQQLTNIDSSNIILRKALAAAIKQKKFDAMNGHADKPLATYLDKAYQRAISKKTVQLKELLNTSDFSMSLWDTKGEIHPSTVQFYSISKDRLGVKDPNKIAESIERQLWVSWLLQHANEISVARNGYPTETFNSPSNALQQGFTIDPSMNQVTIQIDASLLGSKINSALINRFKALSLDRHIHGLHIPQDNHPGYVDLKLPINNSSLSWLEGIRFGA